MSVAVTSSRPPSLTACGGGAVWLAGGRGNEGHAMFGRQLHLLASSIHSTWAALRSRSGTRAARTARQAHLHCRVEKDGRGAVGVQVHSIKQARILHKCASVERGRVGVVGRA